MFSSAQSAEEDHLYDFNTKLANMLYLFDKISTKNVFFTVLIVV
jgi:hypothetical protein